MAGESDFKLSRSEQPCCEESCIKVKNHWAWRSSIDCCVRKLKACQNSGSGKKCDVMKQLMGSVARNEVNYVYHVLSLWCVSNFPLVIQCIW